MKIYEIENLKTSRDFLSSVDDKVILTNPQGSTRYYGMRVIDYMFKTLKQEFPEKIDHVIVNACSGYAAFVTASVG
ncbi:MAG: hypothetical protein H6909_02910 [Rickettsiaceae bacterium]|nr:hypothetical protein [Rickettsiaceae bacterium]